MLSVWAVARRRMRQRRYNARTARRRYRRRKGSEAQAYIICATRKYGSGGRYRRQAAVVGVCVNAMLYVGRCMKVKGMVGDKSQVGNGYI